jgi:hypothetical protein
MQYEKDGYTWGQTESLEELIQPARMEQIKEEYIKRMEKKSKANHLTSLTSWMMPKAKVVRLVLYKLILWLSNYKLTQVVSSLD